MDRILQKPIPAVFLLIILCGYLFFFQSGKLALTDPDETFYAQTAREMAAKGEWVTPYLYGKPQFEKPILFYWLVEASYKVFGVNEFAARFPSAVFGLLGVMAIYLLGALLFGRRAGFLSALVMATSVEYIILSRACITDMALNTFLVFGILFFLRGYIKEKGYFYILAAASFGLATLTKGPVYLIFGVGTIVVFLLFRRDLKALLKMPIWQSALVFIIIAAPWYALVYKLHGNAFIDAFFGFHNITRFLESEHKIGSQFYYNIPILLGGFFPWSVFAPFGLWRMVKKTFSREKSSSDEKTGALFILVWLFAIFTFFTASSTKLPTYVFPCFISLALIVGSLWDDFLSGAKDAIIGTKVSHYLLVAIIVIGSVIAPIAIKAKYSVLSAGIAASASFLVFGMLLSAVAFYLKRYTMAFMLVVYAVALFLYPLSELVVPQIERLETSREVAQKLKPLMGPSERLGSESNYLPGLAFYADKAPANLDRHHEMVQFMNSKERVWVVMKEKNHIQLYDPTVNKFYVKPSYLIYKAGKRAIVTNEMPANGEYISRRELPQ